MLTLTLTLAHLDHNGVSFIFNSTTLKDLGKSKELKRYLNFCKFYFVNVFRYVILVSVMRYETLLSFSEYEWEKG